MHQLVTVPYNAVVGSLFQNQLVISAADVIGKTLYARKDVNVYISPYDNAIPIGKVKAGNPIGVVYTWVDPKMSNSDFQRSNLWWCFVEKSGSWYYVPHDSSAFDVKNLQEQGVISVDEKARIEAEKQKRASMQWWEIMLTDYVKPVAIGAIVLFAAPGIIRAFQKQ